MDSRGSMENFWIRTASFPSKDMDAAFRNTAAHASFVLNPVIATVSVDDTGAAK